MYQVYLFIISSEQLTLALVPKGATDLHPAQLPCGARSLPINSNKSATGYTKFSVTTAFVATISNCSKCYAKYNACGASSATVSAYAFTWCGNRLINSIVTRSNFSIFFCAPSILMPSNKLTTK